MYKDGGEVKGTALRGERVETRQFFSCKGKKGLIGQWG